VLRLALLDDHPAVLADLRRLIEPQPDMIVIAAAPAAGELSRQLDGARADVLVRATT
jgi:DNA-binding NarL/FixJ family response regulator